MSSATKRPRLAPALMVSAAWGAVGAVLFVVGALAGSQAAFVAGFVAGALSLGAALYWRSQLVSEWAERKRGRPR